MAKRKRRSLYAFERDTARFLLADGVPVSDIARRLDCDVRDLDDLVNDPAARDLTDLDRALIGFRNALALYESERDRLLRFQKLVPGDIPPNGHRDKAIRYLDHCRQHAESARRHLETVHKFADQIRALGGGDVTRGSVVEIPVPGGPELGDLPHDDRHREGTEDDADQ